MSQPNNKPTTEPDEGTATPHAHKQSRRRARDEEEEKQSAAPSSHVSPAMRIYQHALESICGMLELDDLSRILGVSLSWSAAVRSMAPINATIDRCEWISRYAFRALPPIESIVASPLMRHIAALQIRHQNNSRWTPLNNASLSLLSQHAPNLTSLWCTLTLPSDEPLVWPAKLST